MYKIAVIGDHDSIYGFEILGLSTYPIQYPDEARQLIRHFYTTGKYGIVYITEEMAAEIQDEIERYQHLIIPAIIQIPGITGNTGAGVENVKKSVEQAIGSDILFSKGSNNG